MTFTPFLAVYVHCCFKEVFFVGFTYMRSIVRQSSLRDCGSIEMSDARNNRKTGRKEQRTHVSILVPAALLCAYLLSPVAFLLLGCLEQS